MPKGGKREGAGRPKGTTNELILENQDKIKKAGVVDFLIEALVKGHVENKPIEINKRIDIAQFLAGKFMPSQKAVEVTGENGGDVILKIVSYKDVEEVK